jgi:hypothetical protein
MLFHVGRKEHPSVYDRGTIYKIIKKCSCCQGITEIEKMGLFLPSWGKPFGLIKSIGGIVASKKAVDYLLQIGLNEFEIKPASVLWGKRSISNENYYEIIPKNILELDTNVGPGPVVVCNECGRNEWQEKNMELPKLKDTINSHIFKIKNTLMIIVDKFFIDKVLKVPDGNYLDFKEWFYQQ